MTRPWFYGKFDLLAFEVDENYEGGLDTPILEVFASIDVPHRLPLPENEGS